jgi:hypothetical protein
LNFNIFPSFSLVNGLTSGKTAKKP